MVVPSIGKEGLDTRNSCLENEIAACSLNPLMHNGGNNKLLNTLNKHIMIFKLKDSLNKLEIGPKQFSFNNNVFTSDGIHKQNTFSIGNIFQADFQINNLMERKRSNSGGQRKKKN